MQRLKKILMRFLLILLSIIFLVFLSEIILRLLPEKYQQVSKIHFFITDKNAAKCIELNGDVIYRHIKNRAIGSGCPQTDQYGFRFMPENMNPDVPTIIFIGDSFTFGHGVNNNETYPWHISRLFQESKYNVNIYNAAIPGYGMDQEIVQLETEILPIMKPDIVVWNIHENDVYDNNQACLFSIKNESLVKHNAKLNTLYILGTIHTRAPEFIKSTKLYWFLLSILPSRWTYGCSIAENSNNFEVYQLKKIGALMDYMNKLKEIHHFKLTVVFIQGQYGYETEGKQPPWYKNRINKILNVIKQSTTDPVIVSDRIKNQNLIAQNANSPVLGATTDLSQKLFLAVDGAFEFGSKHMNATGNLEVAKAVFPALNKIIFPITETSHSVKQKVSEQ